MRGSSDGHGFTLLEVMVAIAILAISLVVLLSHTGSVLNTSRRAEYMTIASMLARQKMADIEIGLRKDMRRNEFPDEKSEEGTFDEPYEEFSWAMEIRRVELPAPVTGKEGSLQDMIGKNLTKQISTTVRELKLIVRWGEPEDEEEIDVVTHIVKLK